MENRGEAVRKIRFMGRLVNLGGVSFWPIVMIEPQCMEGNFLMILYPPVDGECGVIRNVLCGSWGFAIPSQSYSHPGSQFASRRLPR